MHKGTVIHCTCGFRLMLTAIQYEDCDMGICGVINCPKCKKVILLPRDLREKDSKITEETIELEGEDKGWIGE
jgi:hypothetical protein